MADKKYLITVIEVDDSLLAADRLRLQDMPETLNTLTEGISPCGSLDLLGLFLVDSPNCDAVLDALQEHALPYPRDPPRIAKVVNLDDRRQRPEGPG